MFDLEDASTDGAIDAEEFAIVCSSYGLDKKECEEAFGKMSQVIYGKLYILLKCNQKSLFYKHYRVQRK